MANRREHLTVEYRLVYAVISALLFIFVRLIYSIIVHFVGSQTFAIKVGSPWAQLGMAAIEETVVIVVNIMTGYSVSGRAKYEAGLHERGNGSRMVGRGTRWRCM